MKLLFDQNLSPRLVRQLFDLFPGSAHVQTLGLDCASDLVLWDYARNNHFHIVTKDADFSDRSALAGYPPKVLWIKLGNRTTDEIEAVIRRHLEDIETFAKDKRLGVLAIF